MLQMSTTSQLFLPYLINQSHNLIWSLNFKNFSLSNQIKSWVSKKALFIDFAYKTFSMRLTKLVQPPIYYTKRLSQPPIYYTKRLSQTPIYYIKRLSQAPIYYTKRLSQPPIYYTKRLSQPPIYYTKRLSQPPTYYP